MLSSSQIDLLGVEKNRKKQLVDNISRSDPGWGAAYLSEWPGGGIYGIFVP